MDERLVALQWQRLGLALRHCQVAFIVGHAETLLYRLNRPKSVSRSRFRADLARQQLGNLSIREQCSLARSRTVGWEGDRTQPASINGGRFFFARLPASGIEFDLPLVRYFTSAKLPDAGFVPDIAVQ